MCFCLTLDRSYCEEFDKLVMTEQIQSDMSQQSMQDQKMKEAYFTASQGQLLSRARDLEKPRTRYFCGNVALTFVLKARHVQAC